MRDFATHASVFELVPTDSESDHKNGALLKQSDLNNTVYRTKQSSRVWRRRLYYVLPLILATAPIVILPALSPNLSRRLSYNGCTPSGEFALPYSSSIWDPSHFLTITAAFTPPSVYYYCPVDSGSFSPDCSEFSFTQAKAIDIAWDVVVGRGGQALLIVIAYRLFSRVVKTLMQHGEVGYDVFSAVAFDSGTIGSVVTLGRHALGLTPLPRTRHAIFAYWGMAIATLYIIAMPSLFAAMTGYTSTYAPFLDYHSHVGDSKGLVDCEGILAPVWGRVQWKYDFSPTPPLSGWYPIVYPPYPATAGPEWIEYYELHRSVYSQCPPQIHISDCPAAHIKTYLITNTRWGKDYYDYNVTLSAPMPGIVPYTDGANSASRYTHWLCGDKIIKTLEISQYATEYNYDPSYEGAATGICRAGSGYAWGFSFLLTFVVCILNFIFVLIMYALWIDVRRRRAPAMEMSQFKDAATLVTLAQRDFGPKVGEWTSKGLHNKVLTGKLGMTFADEEGLRKRRAVPYHELGDPHGGDWGGDVVVAEHR